MFFIKYAPEHYRRLLKSIYFLLWAVVGMFWLANDDFNFLTTRFGLEKVFGTIILISSYFIVNYTFYFGFKPIVEKNNKSYITPYVIDLLLLFGLCFCFFILH